MKIHNCGIKDTVVLVDWVASLILKLMRSFEFFAVVLDKHKDAVFEVDWDMLLALLSSKKKCTFRISFIYEKHNQELEYTNLNITRRVLTILVKSTTIQSWISFTKRNRGKKKNALQSDFSPCSIMSARNTRQTVFRHLVSENTSSNKLTLEFL